MYNNGDIINIWNMLVEETCWLDAQILEISMIMGGSKISNYRYVDRNKPSYIAIKIKLVQNYLWENNPSKIKERKLKLLLIICPTSEESSNCHIL